MDKWRKPLLLVLTVAVLCISVDGQGKRTDSVRDYIFDRFGKVEITGISSGLEYGKHIL